MKALFVKELDKVYQSGLPEDDMRERVEEMERMREHVFREADTNHDNLISLDEFILQTKREEFNRDPNWDTVDNQPQFTHEEYLEFERRRQEEVQRLIAQGAVSKINILEFSTNKDAEMKTMQNNFSYRHILICHKDTIPISNNRHNIIIKKTIIRKSS